MANLMTANLPSEDEEDQDYVPDEVDEEERRAAKEKKKPKRLRGAAAGAGADAAGSDEEEGSGQGAEELEDPHAALPEAKREAKRAKVDALWSQLNAAKPAARPAAAGASLAALCKPAAAKKGGGDEAWMRQLGLASKPKPAAAADGDKKKSVAAAALAAAKAAASAAGASRMATVTVTEQRRFAGQTITVNKEVAKDSKEAQKAEAEAAAAAKKQAGLDAVLASLQQAKKVTVLDKSRADWKDFKKTDDTIEEELEMHKRSGDQYLDKQAFLKDAELREYEKERDRRLASDVRNRGRL
ncbi:craniofacial development 1 [Chlorella sorokiniana]|uniref:Craniofacial development 1 n=1 Tax=Chlorella sorokiniana TaxID=3076 RepID=A0A2P6TBS4_CHLSO|nr:craniofacial development 1 [Chlorella sorokiniana]|eukprot:PRW18331.1 craniofacial development 1 [Chlorella sorokiniana]